MERQLLRGESLRCRRCGEVVRAADRSHLLPAAWALATTGLILCILANAYPIMTFNVAGNTQSNLIITGVAGLLSQGYWPIAALVLFCAIVAPFVYFGLVWYVVGAICSGKRWPMVGPAARAAEAVAPWSLIPVFAIACLVAVVKLDLLGSVAWQAGILWITLLALCSMVLSQIFDWEFAARRLGELP